MNLLTTRLDYYHIPRQKAPHKIITSEKLRSDVEAFEAAGGKIKVIPIGMSKYMSEVEKSAKRKLGKVRK